MHLPAARALLQPRALLHHPRDTLKDLINLSWACYNYYLCHVSKPINIVSVRFL